jgi:hypothetical protein
MSRTKELLKVLEISEQLKLADTDLLVSNSQESDETGWHDVFYFRTTIGEIYECKIDRYGGATYHIPNKIKAKTLTNDFESAQYDRLADQHDKIRLWPKADND